MQSLVVTVAEERLPITSERTVMLNLVAEGVFVHESEFCQSNAVVVQGRSGVLVVDAGIQDHEMACLAGDLDDVDQTVVAAFSTHPDWDHVLWHPDLGTPPRYGTARCAAVMRAELSDPDAKARIAEHLEPTGLADQIPLGLLGEIAGLPEGAAEIPWDGPRVRIIEHRAHAPGHAALLVEERKVLVAGDMLSDVFVPMLDVEGADDDPVEDYLAALNLFEAVADDVDVVVPGHGSVGGADELRARIDQDRAYVLALRAGGEPSDPRVTSPKPGWEWAAAIHTGQLESLARRRERAATSG
jgi:glyoxylase-like metal-dependent hydrolase (beta-lactamase superfamily II)